MKSSIVRIGIALGLMGVVALTQLPMAGCSGGSSSSHAAAEFDAETYRGEIEAVEAILYKTAPPDYSDESRAAAAIADLFDAISAGETNRLKRERAATLMFLSARADAAGDGGYAAPDLRATRDAWEKTRLELFGAADWFRSSSPGLATAQTRVVPTPSEGQLYELTRMMDRIDDLIRDGSRECADLGEPDYEPGYEGAEGRAQIGRWRRFARDWDDKLDYAASFMPAQPPFDGDSDFLFAYQDVGYALSELRLVAVGTGDWATPFDYQWQQRFESARAHVVSARARLSGTE
jgi:hypothetical protein